jgi:hypothetical protein
MKKSTSFSRLFAVLPLSAPYQRRRRPELFLESRTQVEFVVKAEIRRQSFKAGVGIAPDKARDLIQFGVHLVFVNRLACGGLEAVLQGFDTEGCIGGEFLKGVKPVGMLGKKDQYVLYNFVPPESLMRAEIPQFLKDEA